MDFPLRLLRFRLVDYIGDKENVNYVRYLFKKRSAFVFTSIEKKSFGYVHAVYMISDSKQDSFGRYYTTEEKACHAMLDWIIRFKFSE